MPKNFFQNKTVLVTGAAGFIGSHLCQELLKQEANVIGVDNFLTGSDDNIKTMVEAVGELEENFTLIEADVNQPPETYLAPGLKIDFVFHLASPASPIKYQQYPRETYLVNSWATHQLLDYLFETNPKAVFLFASTSEIYGDPLEHPQKESYWGNVNPNGVRSCYDESKRMGETVCGVYERDFNMDVRIIRIFNTYGPRMDIDDGRVIPNFIQFALHNKKFEVYGKGNQTRSYCYVTDLVEGILLMMSKEGLKGETVNLGNPVEYTVMKTAQIIKEVLGQKFNKKQDVEYKPLPQDDPTRRRPDIKKAKQLLGWKPKVKFKDGLKETIEFFREKVE